MVEDGEMSEYEKQRLERIKENRARLEALRLPNLASSLWSGVKEKKKKEAKISDREEDDDDDYRPSDEEDGVASSSSEEEDDNENQKVKNKNSPNLAKVKKNLPTEKHMNESDVVDDDELALQQAIALSLGDTISCGLSQNSVKDISNGDLSRRKEGVDTPQATGKRKRRKTNISRVQMTEDEVVAYFFSFDETGKGNITVRDLQRVAIAHDFNWTDRELADMIHSFDNNGDGKLSLEDFQKIVSRCNMKQCLENGEIGSVS